MPLEDFETQIDTADAPDGPDHFVLTVIEGPDAGATCVLSGGRPLPLLVGQSPVCDLRLTDPLVSRRHASLAVKGAGLAIADLGSRNGTYVDRVRIVDAILEGAERVRMGATVLTIEPAPAAGRASALPDATSFGRLRGGSDAMRRLYPLAERIAASLVPVIIEGETGTGKEVLAEAIHERSPRALGPFVVFDCTTAAAALLESELFGHERGAFTGAVTVRRGVFEQADGGTLLIDEIGDLDLPLQAKLLRAIERKEIRRLGSERALKVDVRIIAATRRDLDHEVTLGRFRDDLFHRLAVARIELPPLRERYGDVSFLANAFWTELGGAPSELPAAVLARWTDYRWPGNVRELRNAVARHLALGDLPNAIDARESAGTPIASSSTVPDTIQRVVDARLPFVRARAEVMAEFQRRYLTSVLAEHQGDVGKAAAASGIGRRYFQMLRARGK